MFHFNGTLMIMNYESYKCKVRKYVGKCYEYKTSFEKCHTVL